MNSNISLDFSYLWWISKSGKFYNTFTYYFIITCFFLSLLWFPDTITTFLIDNFFSYTESQIRGSFGGITGLAWAPESPKSLEEPVPKTDADVNKEIGGIPSLETVSSDVTEIGGIPSLKTVSSDVTESEGIPSLESISPDVIEYLADLTKEQGTVSEQNVWKLLRQKRITASMFGVVLRAIDSGKFPDHVFKSLTKAVDLSHVAAIKWGTDNEINAKLAYEAETGMCNFVHP